LEDPSLSVPALPSDVWASILKLCIPVEVDLSTITTVCKSWAQIVDDNIQLLPDIANTIWFFPNPTGTDVGDCYRKFVLLPSSSPHTPSEQTHIITHGRMAGTLSPQNNSTWTQHRNKIKFSLYAGYSRWNGFVQGDTMSGKAINEVQKRWDWKATRGTIHQFEIGDPKEAEQPFLST